MSFLMACQYQMVFFCSIAQLGGSTRHPVSIGIFLMWTSPASVCCSTWASWVFLQRVAGNVGLSFFNHANQTELKTPLGFCLLCGKGLFCRILSHCWVVVYVFLKSVQFQNSVGGNEDLLVKHPHFFWERFLVQINILGVKKSEAAEPPPRNAPGHLSN